MKAPDEMLRDMRAAESEVEDDDLPPITKTKLDVTDARGKRYQGEFVFKVPTLGDQVQIGNLKSRYLPQGAAADLNAATLVEQICYLEVCLQFSDSHPRPDWWKPFDLYDATPISALYAEVMAYEAKFHRADANSGAAEGGTTERQEDNQGADDPGDAPVGRKVQPPAQRRETLTTHSSRGG